MNDAEFRNFIALVLAIGFMTISNAFAQVPEETMVQTFLHRYLKNHEEVRYFDAFADLNGNGKKEAIIYLAESNWCGSGGCTVLILSPNGSGYKLITKMTITRTPIRVLSTSSHGWRDLEIHVGGGGGAKPHEAKLQFNGKKYPSNPSVPPAIPMEPDLSAEILIPALKSYKESKLLPPVQ